MASGEVAEVGEVEWVSWAQNIFMPANINSIVFLILAALYM